MRTILDLLLANETARGVSATADLAILFGHLLCEDAGIVCRRRDWKKQSEGGVVDGTSDLRGRGCVLNLSSRDGGSSDVGDRLLRSERLSSTHMRPFVEWILQNSGQAVSQKTGSAYVDSYTGGRPISIDDVEADNDMRPDFSCPYCYEDFDITSLCSHLEDEHCFETRVVICPICVAKVAKDMVGHITLQHAHLFKHMQRRRRFRRAGAPSNATFSLLGKELREAHLQALLGGGPSRAGSINPTTADPLLSTLVYSLPIPETEDSSKPSTSNDDIAGKHSLSGHHQKPSFEASLTREERQQRWKQADTRARFVQELVLSTILKDR